ncbi:MAG: hypothetical protein BYD32DRAFT_422323 [Podila humilis]|nr:MAG: hypothetical protein BYD32DRAFT_422323 [Podila humilis]
MSIRVCWDCVCHCVFDAIHKHRQHRTATPSPSALDETRPRCAVLTATIDNIIPWFPSFSNNSSWTPHTSYIHNIHTILKSRMFTPTTNAPPTTNTAPLILLSTPLLGQNQLLHCLSREPSTSSPSSPASQWPNNPLPEIRQQGLSHPSAHPYSYSPTYSRAPHSNRRLSQHTNTPPYPLPHHLRQSQDPDHPSCTKVILPTPAPTSTSTSMASLSPTTSYVPSPSSSNNVTHTNTPSKVTDYDLDLTGEDDDVEMAISMIANTTTKNIHEPTLEELEKDLLPPLNPLDPLASTTSNSDSPWSDFEGNKQRR